MLLGYIRISTDSQKDGTSPGEQKRIVQAIAMVRKLGTHEVVLYEDRISGSVPLAERPAGKRLLEDVRPGDTVVAAKLDRMFRDVLDAHEIFNRFKKQQVDLILYDLGHESVIREGISKCFFTIISSFAELERNRIRERVLGGKKAKKAVGGHIGGVAPYGWRVEGEGKAAKLLPEPHEQEVVREVLRLSRDLPPSWVIRELEKRGWRDRAGSKFRPNQVMRMYDRELADAPHA